MYYILFGKKFEVMVSFDCPCAVHFKFDILALLLCTTCN